MAYDVELAERVRAVLASEVVTEQPMFGGLAFLVGGTMGVAVSGSGGLMVRVPRDETQALLAEPGVEPMDMGRGPVRGWVRVSADAIAGDAALEAWVRRGMAARPAR